jgi:protein-L-isoaspartate(D-aspartate) O-methyltransferase
MPADLETAKANMLHRHLQARGISDRRVLVAMTKVPRERFVPPDLYDAAYADRALGIACGQTISQPYMVALMTETLQLSGSEKVLEIGTGSGYQTAVLAELAGEVISIERHEELSRRAGEMLAELGYANLTLLLGDGTLGWPGRSPYDRILVTAAAAAVPPALWEQLAEGGILVIPLGPSDQQMLRAVGKLAGAADARDISPCRFVPLIGGAVQ